MSISKKSIGLIITLCALCVFVFADFSSTKAYATRPYFDYPIVQPTELDSNEDWKTWKENNGSEYSDLVGVYYAEGLGLEVKILPRILKGSYMEKKATGYLLDDDGNVCFGIQVSNYNSGKVLVSSQDNILKKESKKKYSAELTSGKITLEITKKTKNGYKLNVSFSDDLLEKWESEAWESGYNSLYKEISSAEFVDVAIIEKKAVDDKFTGSYLCDDGMDTTYVYSFKQLYGTNDYYMALNTFRYNDYENVSCYYAFYTAKKDLLLHCYGSSVVTGETSYSVFTITNYGSCTTNVDEAGKLGGFYSEIAESGLKSVSADSADYYAYQLSKNPVWEDTGDGYDYGENGYFLW